MIIAIASGKGGTGKTLVATSLALSIRDEEKVQLLDCDVEEPNDHLFLSPVITSSEPVCIPVPKVDYSKCTFCGECSRVCAYKAIAVVPESVLIFDQLCHGCGACSYLCPEKAISEEGREMGVVDCGEAQGIDFVQGRLTVGEAMAVPVIRRVKTKIKQDRVALLDVSPGTSCPVVEAVDDSDYCLLVTEPTPFGLHDLSLAVDTVQQLSIPCGVIINRAVPGETLVHDYCKDKGIPMLLEIPLDKEIAHLYSEGTTLAAGKPEWQKSFKEVYAKIKGAWHERTHSA
ncbi:MAG: ATP-binding protein [Dehalococcoidia bacterium]|nr:ATP-binding protein [Dehalococcoidia bacterium]